MGNKMLLFQSKSSFVTKLKTTASSRKDLAGISIPKIHRHLISSAGLRPFIKPSVAVLQAHLGGPVIYSHRD